MEDTAMNQRVSISRRSLVTASASLGLGLLTTGHSSARSSARVEYDVIDLSPLFASGYSSAVSINNRRLVTGSCTVKTIPTAGGFIWEDEDVQLVSDLSGQSTVVMFPFDANDSNVIVGGAIPPNTSGAEAPAFRITGSAFETLPLIEDRPFAMAAAINQAGVIVGWAEEADQTPRAVIWRDDQVSFLDDHDAQESRAHGINNAGDIVGYIRQSDHQDAAIWIDGAPTVLPRLSDEQLDQRAIAINDAGTVVGISETFVNKTPTAATPWTWMPGATTLTPLASPKGATVTAGGAINQSGWIVGTSLPGGIDPSTGRAILWRDSVAIDLTSLLPADSGWTIAGANDISDRNEIAATAYRAGDENTMRAVLLVRHNE